MTGPHWNTQEARLLYDNGAPWVDIATRLRVHPFALKSYAKRHEWPARASEPESLARSRGAPKQQAKKPARRLARGESTLPALDSLKGDGHA